MNAAVTEKPIKSDQKRLLAALRGRIPDRPPFWLMRQAGRYLPEYRELRRQAGNFLELCYSPDLATEVTLQPIRRFHPDGAILFADILLVPHALGQELDFREGDGPILAPIRSVADLARLRPAAVHERLAPVYETVRRLSRALPADVALIGFAGAPWTVATYMVEGGTSRDHALAKRWAFADPAGFQRLIDLLIDATTAYLDHQIEAGAEVIQLFDTWAGVLPAAAFRRWCLEPVRRIRGHLADRHPNVPVIGFPRGAGALYAEMATIGLDGLGLDAAVPLDWVRGAVPPKLCLQGNLDPQMLVIGGDAMTAAIREILTSLADRPLIFNLGHGIVPETPPEHVAALAAEVRAWRSPS